MKSALPLLQMQKDYRENPSNVKFLEFLADMGKAKVPFRLLRNDYKKVILEEAQRAIDKEIEKELGKERAEEFREWINGARNKYSYLLPQILGEDFSYNILTLLMTTFYRYLYEKFLKEKDRRTPFVRELLNLKVIQDIMQEGLWYKKAPTFAARPLSFQSHPKDTRKKGPKLFVTFLKALLDTDFVCGREEDIEKFRKYLENWLEFALKEEEKEHYKEVEEFFKKLFTKDFKKWFEKHFNVELVQGNCLWFKVDRYETILNSTCNRVLWVSKKIAKSLNLRMNEDELFPTLKKIEKERIKEWIEQFEERKQKEKSRK